MVEYRKTLATKLTLASGAYSNVQIDIPSLSSNKQSFIIHDIEFSFGKEAIVEGKSLTMQLTKSNQTELIDGDNADLIEEVKKVFQTVIGENNLQITKKCEPTEMIPKAKLYFGGKQDSGVSVVITIKIHYSIRWVTQQQINEFIMDNR